MKKVILASLLATMMGTSPVWAADSATAAPTAAATAQVQKEAADVLQVAVQGANRDARRPVRPSGAVPRPAGERQKTDRRRRRAAGRR